ncbi:type II toxin-antitoxin system VapC family toxin [Gordonia araii]|nr:type II toxin-antitoxin system VapC family toxin [Gordonia araii]
MPDINVLIGALRQEADRHVELRQWLQSALESDETLALTPAVVAGYIRIVTNRHIYAAPTPLAVALAHIESLRANNGVVDVLPGPRHWEIFAGLCRSADAKGPLISDADHAATAIEHGATWVTLDRDFARFPGLKWQVPGG